MFSRQHARPASNTAVFVCKPIGTRAHFSTLNRFSSFIAYFESCPRAVGSPIHITEMGARTLSCGLHPTRFRNHAVQLCTNQAGCIKQFCRCRAPNDAGRVRRGVADADQVSGRVL